MLTHSVFYRVCYADTDQMGYVYYGNYARFYEIARVETLRDIGVSYKVLEDAGIGLPVYENYSKYHAPALYDDLLRVNCTLVKMPSARIEFEYRIYNQLDELLHEGKTTLVFMDLASKKVVKAPEWLISAIIEKKSDA
ncbi:thioesterase family protein [Aquirufa sp. 2-AUSEE-184A6]|uniref:Thioesterase family protein n=1 Tax=Aquirufa novilacunae TaxID=3139305 RepID=A0ABW8SSX8_9BACT